MRSRKTIATPPGATIREQLDDRGMRQKEFAQRMDMSEKHISKLINGEVKLTPEVALRLESVLGIPAHFWNNLEALYQEKVARVEAENAMEVDKAIVQNLPYREMAQHGWVVDTRNITERIEQLRRFFEVARLDVLEKLMIPGIACRRVSVNEKSDFALAAWAQKARIDARPVSTGPINLKQLEASLTAIRCMTKENPEDFCPRLVKLLSECGVVLVFLPHMDGSYLHGASFYDGNRIVMGLTVRGKDADKFWFSLFHELGHVLYGHIGKANGTSEEDEQTANTFAANTLIPITDYQRFTEAHEFTQTAIVSFAASIGVDAGIVVGRLQKDNFIQFNWHNELKTKYQIAQ